MRPRTQVLLWLLAMAIILGVGLSVHYAVDVKESSAAGPRTSASPAGSPGASPSTTSARTSGTSITFGWIHLNEGGFCRPHQPLGIYEVAPAGGESRQLTTGCDTTGAWSPDGSQLAFLRQLFWAPTRPGMFLLSAAGGRPRRIWNGCLPWIPGHLNCETGPVSLAWAPDAKHLVLTMADAFIINADGNAPRKSLTAGKPPMHCRVIRAEHRPRRGDRDRSI